MNSLAALAVRRERLPGPLAVALATKHGKQHQFDAPFRRHLNWSLHLAEIDTDAFGTFTAEIARIRAPLATAEAKARAGMECTDLEIGIANEGSFGPHPNAPVIALSVEIAVCVDDRLDIVIAERYNTTETNFGHIHLRNHRDLPDKFLEGARFPSHGLVVHPRDASAPVVKGIHELDRLAAAVADSAAASADGYATIQTDMRAHHNPTRQRAISVVADRLASRIRMLCPACAAPGFGLTETILGLPCEWCAAPTALAVARVLGCYRCEYSEREPVAQLADPGHCPHCNP